MVELPKGILFRSARGVPAATPSDDNRRMNYQVVSPVMVGRDEELSRLEDALLAANRGGSRFVALAGEAGIGKTRLCLKLQERAHKLGLTAIASRTEISGGCLTTTPRDQPPERRVSFRRAEKGVNHCPALAI